MPNYIRKVKLSDKRRTLYFEAKGHIPRVIDQKDWDTAIIENIKNNTLIVSKKLLKDHKKGIISGRYVFRQRVKDKPDCMYDTITNDFVIANPKTAGTAKWEVINGNLIFFGRYHFSVRSKITEQIHEYIKSYLETIPPITKFPLFIECQIHDWKDDPISGKRWDVGNRGLPYCKVFDDELQVLKIVPNDTNDLIACPSFPIFYPLDNVPTDEGRMPYEFTPKLVFNIYHIKSYV